MSGGAFTVTRTEPIATRTAFTLVGASGAPTVNGPETLVALRPSAFVATTRNVAAVPLGSVTVMPGNFVRQMRGATAAECRVRVIVYPVSGEPCGDDACQRRIARPLPGVAVNPVGADGTPTLIGAVMLDGSPTPCALIADARGTCTSCRSSGR